MEQIIISSFVDKKKRTSMIVFAAACIGLAAMLFGLTYLLYISDSNWYTGTSYTYVTVYGERYRMPYTYTRCYNDYFEFVTFYIAALLVVLSIVTWVIFFCIMQSGLNVTNFRVSGKSKFGKVVDLPIDKISSVGISKLFSGITLSTGSGVIKFYLLANYAQIHGVITSLIAERQRTQMYYQQPAAPAVPYAPVAQAAPAAQTPDVAEELKKYKELMDNNIITQEEFEAKKKQLLGL